MPVTKNKNTSVYGWMHRWIDKNGEPHRKKVENKEWGPREAKKQFDKFVNDLTVDEGESDMMTYQQLYDQYLEYKKETIKLRSYYDIQTVQSNHVVPEFGKTKIKDISKDKIKKWQMKLLKGTYKRGEKVIPYSNTMIDNIQTSFKTVLIFGIKHDLINRNPFSLVFVKRPNERKIDMDFWTVEEFKQFIGTVDDLTYKTLFSILFMCGLRKGEMMALQVSDFNATNKCIEVSKTYDTRNHIITTPKTNNSYRTVYLDDNTTKLIEQLIEVHKQKCEYSSKIFLLGFEKPITSTTLAYQKDLYCTKAGVKRIRIHDFRHSHVSMLINQKFGSFDIAQRLGHTVTMVNEVYGHLYPNSQSKIVEKMNSLNDI